MGTLLYGTVNWSEKSWVGPFYAPGTPSGEYLEQYARRFRTVEADVTYFGVPERRTVAGWEKKTPEGFLVAAKFPRTVVHGGAAARPDVETLLIPEQVGVEAGNFIDTMRALGRKCGPLVLQFPNFSKHAFPRPALFLKRLDTFLATLPREFRFAVEVRNHAWIEEPLLDLLRRHRTALVLVEAEDMPHPARWTEKLDLVTTDFVYARLIGDRKAVEEKTKNFDQIVIDKSESLKEWAELLKGMRNRVTNMYVYASNHFAGHAPATIDDLVARIGS